MNAKGAVAKDGVTRTLCTSLSSSFSTQHILHERLLEDISDRAACWTQLSIGAVIIFDEISRFLD